MNGYVRTEIATIPERNYPAYTPELVERTIDRTRARGWALNPGTVLPNSWGIGVALRAPGGEVVGALSVAALDIRMGIERQRHLARLLQVEAERTEARFAEKLGLESFPHPPRETTT